MVAIQINVCSFDVLSRRRLGCAEGAAYESDPGRAYPREADRRLDLEKKEEDDRYQPKRAGGRTKGIVE